MKFAAILSYVLVALVAGAVADPQFGGRQGNVCPLVSDPATRKKLLMPIRVIL